MSDINIANSDWTDSENDLVVMAYLEMLRDELADRPFVKSQKNSALREHINRTKGSIEFKFQNISAVLMLLGFPWISGYKPMHNYQRSLIDAIDRNFKIIAGVATASKQTLNEGMQEAQSLLYEEPPVLNEKVTIPKDGAIHRILKKFDPAERDFRNRDLGQRGEAMIFEQERNRLLPINSNLAKNVRWVSRDDGDGAGYDILSFENDGRERLIEVKTTIGGQTTPFYISRNEISLSREKPEAFKLVRLYNFNQTPRAFELSPPLESHVRIEPINFIAAFS
jgi:Domain of unknown function (DUF3883)